MPEFTISNNRIDFDQIRQSLQEELAKRDSWNDIIEASTGQTLIDFVAAVGAYSQVGIAQALREGFFDTQVIPSSIYRLSRTFGIHISRKIPAQVQVNLSSTTDASIPAYSKFSINNENFFNRKDITFNTNNRQISTTLYQGILRRVSFSYNEGIINNNLSYLRYIIGNKDFSISDYYQTGTKNLTDGDLFARVGTGLVFNGDSPIGSGGNLYNKTLQGLWHHSSTDRVFYENTLPSGNVEVWFGNNIYGISPRVNDSIWFFWIETRGAAANNPEDNTGATVNYVDQNNTTNSLITGQVASTGHVTNGTNERDPEFYKQFGSDIYSARRRAVTRRDYKATILSYPGVIDATVEGQQDLSYQQITDVRGIWYDESTDTIYAIDRTNIQIKAYSVINKQSTPSLDIPRLALLNDTPEYITGNDTHIYVTNENVDSNRRIRVFAYDKSTRTYDPENDIIPEGIHEKVRGISVDDINPNNIYLLQQEFIHTHSLNDGSQIVDPFDMPNDSISIEVANSGSGYTVAPGITIAPPDIPSGATATAIAIAVMGIATVTGTGTQSAALVSGGNYTLTISQPSQPEATPAVIPFTAGANTAATVNAINTAIGGNIVGSRFTSTIITAEIRDQLSRTIDNAGGITFGVTLGVTSINIRNSGNGYTSIPMVTITPGGMGQLGSGFTVNITLNNISDLSGLDVRTTANEDLHNNLEIGDKIFYTMNKQTNLFAYSFIQRRGANDTFNILNKIITLNSSNSKGITYSDDSTFISDNTTNMNNIFSYSNLGYTRQINNEINLHLTGSNDVRWMNVVRIGLLTSSSWNYDINDVDSDWNTFIRWLQEYGMAQVLYRNIQIQEINLNMELEIRYYNRITASVAEDLIRKRLEEFFKPRTGILGLNYNISNITTLIETTKDNAGREIIDHVNLINPTSNVVINRHQYAKLNTLTINSSPISGD